MRRSKAGVRGSTAAPFFVDRIQCDKIAVCAGLFKGRTQDKS